MGALLRRRGRPTEVTGHWAAHQTSGGSRPPHISQATAADAKVLVPSQCRRTCTFCRTAVISTGRVAGGSRLDGPACMSLRPGVAKGHPPEECADGTPLRPAVRHHAIALRIAAEPLSSPNCLKSRYVKRHPALNGYRATQPCCDGSVHRGVRPLTHSAGNNAATKKAVVRLKPSGRRSVHATQFNTTPACYFVPPPPPAALAVQTSRLSFRRRAPVALGPPPRP